jgi:hypothetical protein
MSEERELLEAAAQARTRSHEGHASTRVWASKRDEKGIAGENRFAHDFHLHHDLRMRPKGDGGIDFWLPMLMSVDVKGLSNPRDLLVEVAKGAPADIYVLARVSENVLDAECLGWAWKGEVLAAPQRLVNGVLNYVIARSELRDMAELKNRAAVIGFNVGRVA